jgi:transcriptional regulator with XRE-family HTH domain
MKNSKRSQQKRITTASKILRFMRMSRQISMRAAGARNGISDSSINHYEQGRMDISPARLRQLVASYGYTMQEFEEFASGKPLPVLSIKDECFSLIDRLEEAKLRAVHALLVGFVS